MFPSSYNIAAAYPFSSSSNHNINENPNSTPFLHFPEAFLADEHNELLISHFLSQQQQQILSTSIATAPAGTSTEIKRVSSPSPMKTTTKKTSTKNKRSSESNNGEKQQQVVSIPRKRNGKKDRHSKIITAQGPRDRRMRLSLQIARRFFDLQDMLGFDKASKTIEWLFSKSKSAIKELGKTLPNMKHSCSGKSLNSSTSESEVVSSVVGKQSAEILVGTSSNNRKSRNKPIMNPIARESRDKARARARERTIEKMKMRSGLEKSPPQNCSEEANPNKLNQETNSVAAEEEEEEDQEHQMDSVRVIEKFLGITSTGPRTTTSIFNYLQNNNIGETSSSAAANNHQAFTGNWDNTDNIDRVQYGYCALTNMKGSSGNNLHVQNPSAIFMINNNPNAQEQNPNLVFMSTTSNPHDQQNPSSIFINPSDTNSNSQSPYLENGQFSCNQNVADKFHRLY